MPTQPQNKNSGFNNQNQASGGGSPANPITGKTGRNDVSSGSRKGSEGSPANPSTGKWSNNSNSSDQ